ncbi:MAG TPA: hypothetical protein VHK27_04075 [Gammaproteobacteria bacterium]|nr:hypothetical protein [Gammaproteobacteria bacterium]
MSTLKRIYGDIMPEDLRFLSLKLEEKTGYDSIITIEQSYEVDVQVTETVSKSGKTRKSKQKRFVCCFPDCNFKAKFAATMWRHIHFGLQAQNQVGEQRLHPLSFGKTFEELQQTYFKMKAEWEEFLSQGGNNAG